MVVGGGAGRGERGGFGLQFQIGCYSGISVSIMSRLKGSPLLSERSASKGSCVTK